MSLGHTLLGCVAYNLQPLMATLMAALDDVHHGSGFKTLSPDSWGTSPWYPLLALKELEEAAYPIVKGRRKILKGLKKSRQRREWMIGNYYWALWKWRMKEIHDADFNFVPTNCVTSLHNMLATPVPAHLQVLETEKEDGEEPLHGKPGTASAPLVGDLMRLPPPVSHLLRRNTERKLTDKGKSILRAIRVPATSERSRCPSGREAILRALMDDAYA